MGILSQHPHPTVQYVLQTQDPVLSLNHHLNASQGQRKGFGKNGIWKKLQVPLNSLTSVRTARSSPARGLMGRANRGCPDLGPPPWVMGSIYKNQERCHKTTGWKLHQQHSFHSTSPNPTGTPKRFVASKSKKPKDSCFLTPKTRTSTPPPPDPKFQNEGF